MIVYDVFKEFSRFVPRPALLDLFMTPEGREYKRLKAEIMALDDSLRDSSISAYIFGVDEQAVRSRISQVSGRYLFVDYSYISSTVDGLDVKTDLFHVAVTVAEPHPSDEDQFSHLLRQDGCLKSLAAIRRQMRYEQDLPQHLDWMSWPHKITPFVAPALANSYGWTMEFDVKGTDII